MTRAEILRFEVMVIDLVDAEKCTTASDYEKMAKSLHESVENAIMDLCMDEGIDDYEPQF